MRSKNVFDHIFLDPRNQPGRILDHLTAFARVIIGAFLGLQALGPIVADDPDELI